MGEDFTIPNVINQINEQKPPSNNINLNNNFNAHTNLLSFDTPPVREFINLGFDDININKIPTNPSTNKK